MQCCDGDKLGPEKSLNGLGSKWEGLKVVVATANRIHLVTQLLEGLMCFYETKIKIIPLIWTENAKITHTHAYICTALYVPLPLFPLCFFYLFNCFSWLITY